MTAREVLASWVDDANSGLEKSTVTLAEEWSSIDGRISKKGESPFVLDYSISWDDEWRTRYVFLTVALSEGSGARRLELVASGRGHWVAGDGAPLPELDGALDVDISATPFTNTLAIRRLGLAVGESADIRVAWIAVPELTVHSDPQRYTRLGPNAYRFESLDGSFTREITVDDDGLVLEYPGLFRRVR